MKKLFLILINSFFFLQFSSAQVNLAKQWDHTFGGSAVEKLNTLLQTADGGFILGGYSRSDSSGDVSENSRGDWDYWIVKTDSLGNKIWDKKFGGNFQDLLFSVDQTYDGGYLLGGYTASDGGSGDVTQSSQGSVDYWIVKTDALGNKQWDRRLGGNNLDNLSYVEQTVDSGFILGGFTLSDSSGDVTSNSRGGEDYWLVKTDKLGNKLWDKRYGGNSNDEMLFMQQTTNGGYILGGRTFSDSSGEVSQNSRGASDYWIIKTDQLGNKVWDKRFGGIDRDYFVSLQQTVDGGYILGGYTASDSSGDVSQPKRDTSLALINIGDFWIVKIDSIGTKKWDKRFGGYWKEDSFGYVTQTRDGGYLLGGSAYSGLSGDKTEDNFGLEQSWIIKTDSAGTKQWDKTIFTNREDEYAYPIQISDSCYVIANFSEADSAGYKSESSRGNYDFWFIKLCESQIPQLPVANFTVSNPTICAGGCFSFQNLSYNAGSFLWYFPGASDTTSTVASPANVCYPNGGDYSVTLIASNGSGSDTLTQTNIIHVISLSGISIIQSGDTLYAPQGFVQYQWYFNTVLTSDTNYFHPATQSGDYIVVAYDTNGCPNSDTISFAVGVSEYSIPGYEINVFPNPAQRELNVTGLESSVGGELRIHDLLGRKIYSSKIIASQMVIPVTDFTPGIYILEAFSEHQKYFIRFLKE